MKKQHIIEWLTFGGFSVSGRYNGDEYIRLTSPNTDFEKFETVVLINRKLYYSLCRAKEYKLSVEIPYSKVSLIGEAGAIHSKIDLGNKVLNETYYGKVNPENIYIER